ncbi:hypothetical protein GCT13_27920 [Paraburkholderia sp. CNPSo 3157]|uniref:Uncharacterized protein n=1 Tax=Paraburkholderia franconis TaxID=2654983 RepID=A0A7X1NEP6_9BURK|nr:hypothetical protein [Paraburkholderia franconis]MPW20604.1 hypothetical protein [Paraburkholderia franconis]
MYLNTLISSLRRTTRFVIRRFHAYHSGNGDPNGKGRKSRYSEERRIIEQSGLFDEAFYRETYPDVARAGIDPLKHYVAWGGKEGRRPHPSFDPQWYTTQYPDVLQSGIHPLVHYLTIGRKEGRRCGLDSRVLSVVDTMYEEAGALEPAIALDPALASPHLLGIHGGGQHWPVLRVWRALFESLEHPFRCIVFVAGPLHSGVEAMVVNATQAAIEAHGPDSTLTVFTDHEGANADCAVGFHTRCLSNFGEPLTRMDRASIVEKLILAVRPKAVLNVDSAACWDAIVRKGGALQLATDMYAYLHRVDRCTDSRSVDDFAHTHFREGLPFLRKVYFETLDFQEALTLEYGLPPSLMSRIVHLQAQQSRTAFVNTLQASPSFID